MNLKVLRQTEASIAPQRGGPIYQVEWFAIARGPLVYAVRGLIGDEEKEEIFALPGNEPETLFKPVTVPEGINGKAYELRLPEKPPLLFLPFFESGGGVPGTWRLTWIQERIR